MNVKRLLAALTAGLFFGLSHAQAPSAFDEHFVDKALRVDLYFVGDAKEELVTLDRVVEEGTWPETRVRLLDPFNNGRYAVEVYDVASNALLYSRGFDSMFGEYTTTAPALDGVKRTFSRPVRIPCPKGPVLVVIQKRDRDNIPHPLFTRRIDPSDYHILREPGSWGDETFEILNSGAPSEKVDLLFVAEGYTSEQREKFRADAERVTGWLFEAEPFAGARDRFNVRGLMRPSPEAGSDEPRQGIYKKTSLDASFNAFDLDRYQLTQEGRELRRMAAQVPYDVLVVLVNSKRYGGGGIYNDYCITTVDDERSRQVFLHEFGHTFAGLADEYYLSDVSYNEFYPKGVEPLEPNITAFLDPGAPKWKDLLSPGLALPTEWGKEKIDTLDAERRAGERALKAEIEQAEKKGLGEAEIVKIKESHKKAAKEIDRRAEEVRKQYAALEGKVGLFEGAGYASKGLYRPAVSCRMFSNAAAGFCPICQRAIRRTIDYYGGK